jgi:hypothetical protein
MRLNPLLVDTWRGLTRGGSAQNAYVSMLLVQAAVLILWWPKQELPGALASGDGPLTLAAVAIGIGMTQAYHCLRLGAEEVLPSDQQSLREWAVATQLPVPRILYGFSLSCFVHAFYMMLLSAPLAAMALGLAGTPWIGVGWILAMFLVHSVAWMALGAIVYLYFGDRALFCYLAARIALGLVYLGSALLLPAASAVRVPLAVLDSGARPMEAALPFIGAYVCVFAVAVVALGFRLRRIHSTD